MPTFNKTLNSNTIFPTLTNMIISQQVFADNVKGTYSSLVDKARVDGSMYGDQKLYYASDALKSTPWLNDLEAQNLLALDRPKAPEVQAIVMNQFRQIRVTVDNYLTKQAWATENAFTSFNSVMLGWVSDTKRIYDSTLYNSFIGTDETSIGEQQYEITPVAVQNDALTMAEALANLLTSLKDVSRDYNDYGFIRSYAESDLLVVWNAKQYNALKKVDMPVIFHNEGLLNEFEQEVLPARYFGRKTTTANVTGVTGLSVVGTTVTIGDDYAETAPKIRTLVEGDFVDSANDNAMVHLFPADELPVGATFEIGEAYFEDDTIAFKVMHKNSVPYMSGFSTSTEFFNPRSLTSNHYLTFGYNDLEHLKNYPMITARFAEAN